MKGTGSDGIGTGLFSCARCRTRLQHASCHYHSLVWLLHLLMEMLVRHPRLRVVRRLPQSGTANN